MLGPMNRTWIYTPRSHDRVFANRFTPSLVVQTLPNKSRIVWGGVRLTYAAAVPKNWWRDSARAVAASLVSATGGVAWDENGEIGLVVPHEYAWEVNMQMNLARSVCLGSRDRCGEEKNNTALVMCGAASFDLLDDCLIVARKSPEKRYLVLVDNEIRVYFSLEDWENSRNVSPLEQLAECAD